jgi:hypothetical protein
MTEKREILMIHDIYLFITLPFTQISCLRRRNSEYLLELSQRIVIGLSSTHNLIHILICSDLDVHCFRDLHRTDVDEVENTRDLRGIRRSRLEHWDSCWAIYHFEPKLSSRQGNKARQVFLAGGGAWPSQVCRAGLRCGWHDEKQTLRVKNYT